MKNLMMFCVFVAIFYLNAVFNVKSQSTSQILGPNTENCTKWRTYVWSVCTLTKKCSASSTCRDYPEATCRLRHGRCGKCVERFYIGRNEVLCAEECPLDQPAYDCVEPACDYVQCDDRAIQELPCRSSRCGKCHALFRFGDNDWRECPGARYNTTGRRQAPRPRRRMTQLGRNSIQRATASLSGSGSGPRRPQRGRMAGPGDITEISRCPASSPEVPCSSELCANLTCRRYPEAKCVVDKCGVCHVDWMVGRQIVNCNVGDRVESCPADVPAVPNCNACNYAYCENFPEAECRNDDCGKCKAEFFINNQRVECTTPPNYIDECPIVGNQRYVCPKEMCRFHVCPNNHRVYCTVNNCGGCRAVYRYKWTREVATCTGYWTRYENDTAKKGYVATEQDITSSFDSIIAEFERRILEENAAILQDQAFMMIPQEPLFREARTNPQARPGRDQPQTTDIRRGPQRRIEPPQIPTINDPHAGHGHDQPQNTDIRRGPLRRNEPSQLPAINDPHAGHGHDQPQNTDIRRGPLRRNEPSQLPALNDPHAGHGHIQPLGSNTIRENSLRNVPVHETMNNDLPVGHHDNQPQGSDIRRGFPPINDLHRGHGHDQITNGERHQNIIESQQANSQLSGEPRVQDQLLPREEINSLNIGEMNQPQFLPQDQSTGSRRRLSRPSDRTLSLQTNRPQRPRIPAREERLRSQTRVHTREERQRTHLLLEEQRPEPGQRPQHRLPTRQERQRPRSRVPTGAERRQSQPQLLTEGERQRALSSTTDRQRLPNAGGRPTRRRRRPTRPERRQRITLTDTVNNGRRPERIPRRTGRRETGSTTSQQPHEPSAFQDGQSTQDRGNGRNLDRTSLRSQNLRENLNSPRATERPISSNRNSGVPVEMPTTDTGSSPDNSPNSGLLQSPLFDAFGDLQFPLFDLLNMENSAGIPIPLSQHNAQQGA